MAITSGNDSWEKIQGGVKETERLIGQRDYNAAMIKARTTLEFMTKQLAERAAITNTSDLKELIDTLYETQWINKATCEHYHKIRMIGNKAAHEGDTSAYNANQAYHMLSQEVYTFANNYSNAQKGSRAKQAAHTSTRAGAPAGRTSAQGGRSASAGQADGNQATRNAAQSARNVSTASRNAQARRPASSSRSRGRQPQRRRGFTAYDLLKLLIPILCIVLLFFVVKLFKPGKDDAKPTKEQVTTEATVPATDNTEVPSTEAEETAVTYKTTTTLNVRPEPNTDTERIGKLPAGTVVEYVGVHDADWAIILFEGQEAYVASKYLTTE